MEKNVIKNYLKNLRSLLRDSPVRVSLYGASIILIITSSLFEGISIGLLLPLFNLLIDNKHSAFSSHKIPLLNSLLEYFHVTNLRVVFFILVAIILFSTIVKNVLVFTSELIISKTIRRVEHYLRVRIFDRYLSFSKIYFDKKKIGNLSDLAVSQVIWSCRMFERFHNIFLNGIMMVTYTVIMLVISWQLTLVSFLFLPVVYYLVVFISKKIHLSTQHKFIIDQEINAYLNDSLSNMSLIHAYTNEAEESKRYTEYSEKSYRNLHSIAKKSFFSSHAQDVISTGSIAMLVSICLLVFIHDGGRQTFGIAAFLTFFIFLRRFSSSMSVAGAEFAELVRSFEPFNQIMDIFDDQGKEFVRNGSKPFSALNSGIELKHVFFGYNSSPTLRDVCLSFEKGKMTAIVGPTGSGKTTLIHMIPRFYDATAGSVTIDGTPIREFDLASLRSQIALVSQDVQIINDTIKKNVEYSFKGTVSDEEFSEILKKACLYDFVNGLPEKCNTYVGERGIRLSGGEKQRIAIARAILKKPEIFIFDEATSSLDMETELAIQKAIENFTRGRTVIVIAHRLSTIKNADRIIVLERGAVTEEGWYEDLIRKKGRFYHYWGFQVLA